MEDTMMSITAIVKAAMNDVYDSIEDGKWMGVEEAGDNEENVYTIISLYSQFSLDENAAEKAIWTMFEKEFDISQPL
jgi:hypothetical protein